MAWDFQQVKANIKSAKRDMPRKLANQARNYFVSSWTKQGWDGQPWKQVQRRTPGTRAYRYASPADRTRAILVGSGSGRLRRAVSNSIRKADFGLIKLAVGDQEADYAGYHNKGTEKIPKRQFMGQTRALTQMQKKMIDSYFIKVWKS